MWGCSILQRLGFRRRVATTGKVEVLEGARKEAGLQHHFRNVNIIKKHNIPKSLALNSDQTPSKYVAVGRTGTRKFNSSWFGWKYRQAQHYVDFDSHTRWKNITIPDNL